MIFGSPEKAKRKKDLKEFYDILTVPFILSIIGSIFADMALLSFTGQAPGKSGGLAFKLGGGYFVMMCILTYLWGRPALLYVSKPTEALKQTIRRRIGNIYRDGLMMLVIVQALSLVPELLAPGRLTPARLGATAVSFLSQLCLLVVYIDAHLTKQKVLMQSLYSEKELYSLRQGFSIPVFVKLSMTIVGFAILPFVLVYVAFFQRIPWDTLSSPLAAVLGISAIVLFSGLNSVYNGIQKPLDGLIARMKGLATGDYSKTRIYFSDEVAYLKAGYNEMVDGLKEREELQDTFGKYMSIEIARELIHNKKVNLGGEDIEAAVMFCDIRNFTPLSEKMSASELVEFLNSYFHYITPPIDANNGVINKFIGDAVMAIFTPPLGSSDYAADAVRAALAMRRALAEFNASGRAPATVEFGIGIHCGKLVAGNIGTSQRLEYTFIGDTVNVASRLEAKTKDFGADILLSEAAMEKAKGSVGPAAAFQPLGKAPLKGKSEPMELYKVA